MYAYICPRLMGLFSAVKTRTKEQVELRWRHIDILKLVGVNANKSKRYEGGTRMRER